MRVFVGEYVCGGGFLEQSVDGIPRSLRTEGEAMLRAIVCDLAKISDVVVALDPRMDVDLDASRTVPVDSDQALWGQWIEAAKDCDAAIIVAPESDGVLAKAAAVLRAGGVDVIASSGDFLRVASDKLQTAKLLWAAGVAHPMYLALSDRRFEDELSKCDRFVVKPRHGCGATSIRVYDQFDEALGQLAEDELLQALVPGTAVSIALVASPNQQTFLPAVRQELSLADCSYNGGCGPLDDESQRRASALSARAIAAMPPMARGFVGVDLILGSRPSEDCVIEINPRLTTSYVGLRRMIRGNLAARLFDQETGPVACQAAVDSVRWHPNGDVWIDDTVADPA